MFSRVATAVAALSLGAAGVILAPAAQAGTSGAEKAWTPPSCQGHRANTAVWVTCKGKGSASQVRMVYECRVLGQAVRHTTAWESLGARSSTTISEECTFEAVSAKGEYRKP
ncbi:hypothetical protein IPZ58_12430 [Streptomyces roseoverticillatus]|uniref:hypothetical protein n=1 Tax=Streptomyces roseoverticillatus TaxID=66429 RepID=UPI001F26527F|nr:hypothetical protein [Streptomyces roseoverticillatus]MCF3102384.1 hypothetical protein [Streptomyces roseoverticillatus]